jgi:hypothetical protein
MIRLLVDHSRRPPVRFTLFPLVVRVLHLLPGLDGFNISLCELTAGELLQGHPSALIVRNDLLLIANLNAKAVWQFVREVILIIFFLPAGERGRLSSTAFPRWVW